jgi:hypothetical protein
MGARRTNHASVNPLNINDLARSAERRSGTVGRQFLAADAMATPHG